MRYIIAALHEQGPARLIEAYAKHKGDRLERTTTSAQLEALLEEGTPDILVMDANLGNPGSADITPARDAYARVRGHARFIAMTGSFYAEAACRREGIPVILKGQTSVFEFLE